jgi:hypothetical protein
MCMRTSIQKPGAARMVICSTDSILIHTHQVETFVIAQHNQSDEHTSAAEEVHVALVLLELAVLYRLDRRKHIALLIVRHNHQQTMQTKASAAWTRGDAVQTAGLRGSGRIHFG